MTSPYVTKAQYAQMRGCAPSAVTKAIKEKRISVVLVGKREMIDVARANEQWAHNTRPRGDSSAAPLPMQQLERAEPLPLGTPSLFEGPAHDPDSYETSRRRREAAEASIAEMKQAEMEGALIRVDAVRSSFASKISGARDALLQIPSRLAPVLAAEADILKVNTALEDSLRQALAELSGMEAS